MRNKKATASGHFHAVRFYEDDSSLCRIVAEFIHAGLTADQPAVVIATPAHEAGLLKWLSELNVDTSALRGSGQLTLLDAGETMARFMVDGMPSQERFQTAMIAVLEKACRGRVGCTVRAYGEMVDLLWQAGMHSAAIRLEMLWNQLANTHQFSLLCGYSMGSFYKDAAYEDICDQHTHVVSIEGEAARLH
jgi:MEDS: MEthanogen/methylotroph, DcmR Sensory domain